MDMFESWFENILDIYRFNFAMFTLILRRKNCSKNTKEENAFMNKFRPISNLSVV